MLAHAERTHAHAVCTGPGIDLAGNQARLHQATRRHHDFAIAGVLALTVGGFRGAIDSAAVAVAQRDAGRPPIGVHREIAHGELIGAGVIREPLGGVLEAVDRILDLGVLDRRAEGFLLPLQRQVGAFAVAIDIVGAQLEARHVSLDVVLGQAVVSIFPVEVVREFAGRDLRARSRRTLLPAVDGGAELRA